MRFFDWLDHRTGFRKLRDALLLEHIPGGAKWRYVWGSALAFVFLVQLITGVLLMFHYSPGDSTAWGSVYFIQYEMDFGWLIRGLHHFGSQTMVVLLGIHMLQVVIAGAHLPPREINWWLGLALLAIVLGLSLTGYLLPWDQKGFWATQVATNILGSLPGVGEFLQKIVVGGSTYGHHTLTHFYALHVGVLPPLLIVLLIAHIAIFRRHGVTAPANAQGHDMFWPAQAFRDMLVSMIIFGVMLALVVFGGHGNKIDVPPAADGSTPGFFEDLAKAGQKGWGANLDAPADLATEEYPARPEWYFLFLFQLLKYFEGEQEIIGTVVIPNAALLLLLLLPLLGYGRMRKFGHAVGVVVVVGLLASVGLLTVLAVADDSPTPLLGLGGSKRAQELDEKFKQAAVAARRAVQLAHFGIPAEGAKDLLRHDPMTRGRKLFETHCASCHSYTLTEPEGDFTGFADPKIRYSASDLGDFPSAAWNRGLLRDPSDPKYFGRTKLVGMKKWIEGIRESQAERKKEDPAAAAKEIAQQEHEFDVIARMLGQQRLPADQRDPQVEKEGRTFFFKKPGGCAACHSLDGKGSESAPDLTGYGSQDWIRLMMMAPAHVQRHAAKNFMPAFRDLEGPAADVHTREFRDAHGDDAKVIHLSNIERELIIRFMTRDGRVVFGGQAVGGPKR